MEETPSTSTTVYDGPPLTAPQVDALRSVANRGDLLHVHPTRARTLAERGLIDVPDWSPVIVPAALTDAGHRVLTDASACSCAEQANLHGGHCCLRDLTPDDTALRCSHGADFKRRAEQARKAGAR